MDFYLMSWVRIFHKYLACIHDERLHSVSLRCLCAHQWKIFPLTAVKCFLKGTLFSIVKNEMILDPSLEVILLMKRIWSILDGATKSVTLILIANREREPEWVGVRRIERIVNARRAQFLTNYFSVRVALSSDECHRPASPKEKNSFTLQYWTIFTSTKDNQK